MKRLMGCAIVVCLLLCGGFIPFAKAQGNDIVWRGFAAQGVIEAQDSNYIDDHGDVSMKLTELGINSSYRVSPEVRIAAQGVYLNGGNRYPEGVRLDYLFVDWQFFNALDWQANLHLGRIKNHHWLYSATRDVPHTRPTIILPQSVYFDAFRDVALGTDGVGLFVQNNSPMGDFEFVATYGSSPISSQQAENLLGHASQGDLDLQWDRKASLFWQPSNSNLRFGISALNSDFIYRQGNNDIYIDGTATSQRLMGHLTYFSEHWDLAIELMRERVIYRNFIAPGFRIDATAEGGYIQGRYHFSPSIAFVARMDLFDLDRTDRSGKRREQETDGQVPAYFGFQDQMTLGVTWEFHQNWRFQAEVHRVKGTGRLAPVLMPDTELNQSKYWNIWAAQLMYWF